MSSSKLQESSEVRIGHSLNELEKEFVTTRIKTVQKCLENNKIPCSLDKVPKIALLGSGGGERAMLGLLGSLDELKKTGLLDCILYLSGVSGSTWCMTSLYQDSDWSTNLDSVKQKIIQTLSGPGVTWRDAFSKLRKYRNEKDIFNLTYVWAVMIVTSYMKEINEHKISEQRGHNKDPFPIYNVIDKGFKQQNNKRDTWFEISPHEAGYSLTGAFVDVSQFGSKFEGGCKIKDQPEMDMLYLQAMCGSCIADGIFNLEYIWKKIKEFIHHIFDQNEKIFEEMPNANMTLSIEEVHQLFMDLVEMNLSALKDEDTSAKEKAIIAKLSKLDGGECKLEFQMDKTKENFMKDFTVAVCEHLKLRLNIWQFDLISCICASVWVWGREYNFVYKMKDDIVPTILQDSKTRDYIDAGLLLNSPYMSVLRHERDIDLIISLDFSEGDPFETVRTAAEMCREQKIPFPEVSIPSVKYPDDFYVFEGHGEAPTVIHIPLFNTVNCGDNIEEWINKYRTIKLPYRPNKIDPLVDVAGKNITNNKEKLLREIIKCIVRKSAEHRHDYIYCDCTPE